MSASIISKIRQLQAAENLLMAGMTAYSLAKSLGVSVETSRRAIRQLRALGVEIDSDYIDGDKEAAIFKAKRSTRFFR